MTQLSPREFERAALRGVLSPAMPYLEEELHSLEEQRLRSAFAGINAGTLTPEAALSTLMEVKSYRDLARKMRQRAALQPEVQQ
jgi:hypothetical protein